MNTFYKRLLSAAFLLLLCRFASAQDSIRSKYVDTFSEYSMLNPFVQGLNDSFSLKPRGGKEESSFVPNNTYQLGCGVYFFGIGFDFAYSLQPSDAENKKYGTTTYHDIRTNFLYGNWGINFFTKKYHGFYREDNFGNRKNQIALRPDITTTNNGVEGIYALNQSKFSLCSSYIFSERQIKSSGSVILSGTVNKFTLASDSAVASNDFEQAIKVKSSFNFLRYTTMSIAPGYSHNIVWKHFFANVTFAVGPAYHWMKFVTDEKTHYDINLNTYYDFRLALGYNGTRFFGGVNLTQLQRNIQLERVTFSNSSYLLRLNVGMRIKDKGFMKKRVLDIVKNAFKQKRNGESPIDLEGY